MAQEIDSAGWTGAPEHRISLGIAGAMVSVALLLDGAQDICLFLNGIPLVGSILDVALSWYISFLAAIIFGIWFGLLRVNYFAGKNAGKKLLIAFSSVVIELIPFVDALPAITFGVIGLIIQTRLEDSQSDILGAVSTIASGSKGRLPQPRLPQPANDNEAAGREAA